MYGIAGWRNTPGMPKLKSLDELYPDLKGHKPKGHAGNRSMPRPAISHGHAAPRENPWTNVDKSNARRLGVR